MSSHRRRAGIALLLALVIVCQLLLPVWSASPPPAGPNIAALGPKFQVMATGPVQRNAVREIFPNYSAYRHLIATGKVAAPTARAVDEVLVTLYQEIWRDVAVRQSTNQAAGAAPLSLRV